MGVLGWIPPVFWKATPLDLYPAVEGWMEAHGVNPDAPRRMTEQELVQFTEEMMERFPDG